MSAMVILPQAALADVLSKNAAATAPNTFVENLIFIFLSPKRFYLYIYRIQRESLFNLNSDYSNSNLHILNFFDYYYK
jgi:hypothetical protein